MSDLTAHHRKLIWAYADAHVIKQVVTQCDSKVRHGSYNSTGNFEASEYTGQNIEKNIMFED